MSLSARVDHFVGKSVGYLCTFITHTHNTGGGFLKTCYTANADQVFEG